MHEVLSHDDRAVAASAYHADRTAKSLETAVKKGAVGDDPDDYRVKCHSIGGLTKFTTPDYDPSAVDARPGPYVGNDYKISDYTGAEYKSIYE